MATKKYLDDNGLVHFWHKIKQFVAGAVPTSVSVGSVFFDTTLNKPIWNTGSAWVDATGASV